MSEKKNEISLLKKVLYLVGVLLLFGLLLLLSTGIAQLVIAVIGKQMNLEITDEELFSISGSFGIIITSTLYAIHAKGKKHTLSKLKGFHILAGISYILPSICICKILIESLSAILFAKILPVSPVQSVHLTWIDVFMGIIISPIFEELLFRFGLYHLINRKFSKKVSMVVCTILFSVLHLYNIQGFLSCFGAGIVFSLIYIKTGHIGYSILAHIGCNAFSAIMNVLENSNVKLFNIPLQYEMNGYNMFHPMFIVAAMLIVGIYLRGSFKNGFSRTGS